MTGDQLYYSVTREPGTVSAAITEVSSFLGALSRVSLGQLCAMDVEKAKRLGSLTPLPPSAAPCSPPRVEMEGPLPRSWKGRRPLGHRGFQTDPGPGQATTSFAPETGGGEPAGRCSQPPPHPCFLAGPRLRGAAGGLCTPRRGLGPGSSPGGGTRARSGCTHLPARVAPHGPEGQRQPMVPPEPCWPVRGWVGRAGGAPAVCPHPAVQPPTFQGSGILRATVGTLRGRNCWAPPQS